MFVLDTNTVIYFFKGMGRVSGNLLAQPPAEVAIPAIVVYELGVGIAKSNAPAKRNRQLQTLLNAVEVLPFGVAEARSAANLRATLEQLGTPISRYDTLIAGTALAHGATVVTHNVKEFGRVPGLRLVDWY